MLEDIEAGRLGVSASFLPSFVVCCFREQNQKLHNTSDASFCMQSVINVSVFVLSET